MAEADRLEESLAGIAFYTALVGEHGYAIHNSMGECYADSPQIEKDAFGLVADIDCKGEFNNVAVQPDTAASRCYAAKIDALTTRVPRPVVSSDKPYPVVLKIRYNK